MSRPSARVIIVLVVVASLGLAGRGRWWSDTSAASPSAALRIFTSEFAFQPSEIDVPVDTPVTITLVNAGPADHAFDIDALGVHAGPIHGGESTTFRITAPAAHYPFLCGVPGHALLGMTGILRVGDAPPGTPVAATPIATPVP